MARSCILTGAFDLAVYGSCTINFTDDAGANVATAATAVYDHGGIMADAGLTSVSVGSFGAQVQTAMNAAALEDYAITFNRVTGRYTIANTNDAVFTITWTGAAGLRMRALLGFVADCSGALTYTSTRVPLYCMVPTSGGVTDYAGIWQDKGQIASIRSSAGQPYRLGPATLPWRTSFTFEYETRAAVDRVYRDTLASSVTHLYTWETMWEDYGRNALLPIAIEMVGANGFLERFAFDLATPEYDETTHKPRAKNDHVRWTVTMAAMLRQLTSSTAYPARAMADGAAVAPVNTVAGVASGTVTVGGALACTDGTWTGTAPIVYTYQWQRGDTIGGGGTYANIGGATSSGYTAVAADIGYSIRRATTGTNGGGASTGNSNALIWSGLAATLASESGSFDETGQTGSPINSWTKAIGATASFEQAGANRPAAGTFGTLAAPDFDGADDYMTQVGLPAPSGMLAVGGYEYWIAFIADTATATNADPRSDNLMIKQSNDYLACSVATIAAVPKVLACHFDTGVKSVSDTIALAAKNLVNVSFNGSRIRLSVNGGADVTVAAANVGDMATGFILLGGNGAAATSLDGRMGTLVTCQAEQTAGARADVTAFLRNKWGTV